MTTATPAARKKIDWVRWVVYMKKRLAIILGLALASPTWVHAEDKPTPDVVSQKVLRQHGVDSTILRSYDQLQETSPRADGRFFFTCGGLPGLQVLLDRDYWVLAIWSAKKDNDVVSYLFNPTDEQCALNISVGNDRHERSDADLAKEPGFSGITSGVGVVGGKEVKWRRWSDAQHLYSDCKLLLSARDQGERPNHKADILITANSEERRSALEQCMTTLKLQYSKE